MEPEPEFQSVTKQKPEVPPLASDSKSAGGSGLIQSLTEGERRLYLQHRIVSFITELTFGLNSACMNLKLIDLSGGDMGRIAVAHAWHWCFNAAIKNFTNPLVASLSDS